MAPLGAHSSKGTRRERSCTVPHSQTRKLPLGVGATLGPLPTSKWITTSIRTMSNETAADQAETRKIGPLALHGLFPEYQEKYHKVYLDVLNDAVDKHPEIRNIALTGAYGTGKSSILAEFSKKHARRVVSISLSSVGDRGDQDAADSNVADEKTNLIQKEIVKQILYKEKPSKMPSSRFLRASHFRWVSGSMLAALVSLLVTGVIYLTGVSGNMGAAADATPVRVLVTYGVVWTVVGALCLGILWLAHGRITLEKLTAGPATVSLKAESGSYFDKYLDEIVYYFEISRRDIVVFEDLDRFDNVQIFETLRALNTLLNGSAQVLKQTEGRKLGSIRFIYALRDSVFEKLGTGSMEETNADHTPGPIDEAQAEVQRANRTKFFDLVVPVVPFITHKNARDLMTEAMRGTGVTSGLIDLAAGHVADMRLIWNLRNEYEVFSCRLLNIDDAMPGLDPDRLFAMLLYKSVHMADFEDIRFGRGRLDDLHATWRQLVAKQLEEQSAILEEFQRRLSSADSIAEASTTLGTRFAVIADVLLNAWTNSGDVMIARVANTDFDRTRWGSPELWRKVFAEKTQLFLILGLSYRSPVVFGLEPDDVAQLLDISVNPQDWKEYNQPAIGRAVARTRRELEFLRHHSWEDACRSPLLSPPGIDDPTQSFRAAVDSLPSALARQLVRRGFINDYFTLYISQYYGKRLSRDALNFIVHAIDKNEPDYIYPLTPEDVDGIITERGEGIVTERSMLNVNVLDHLINTSSSLVDGLIQQIREESSEKHAFLSTYLFEGAYKRDAIELLAPLIPDVFTYVVTQAPVDDATRLDLLDAALTHWSDDLDYLLDDNVRRFVENNVPGIPALATGSSSEDAERAGALLEVAGVRVPDLAALSPFARAEAIKRDTYRISEANILLAAGANDIGLDTLRTANPVVYWYLLRRLNEYLTMFRGSCTNHTATTRDGFFTLVNDAAGTVQPEHLAAIINAASPDCTIANLEDVPAQAWNKLVADKRIPNTYRNVTTYLSLAKTIDEPLADLLRSTQSITDSTNQPLEERQTLALQLLAATDRLPDPRLRAQLAASLNLDSTLPAVSLTGEPGELVGLLIEGGIIADDVTAFADQLMPDWETREFAISRSKAFAEFVAPDILPTAQLGKFLNSGQVPDDAKRAVLADLVPYIADAETATLETAARAAIDLSAQFDAAQLETLKAGRVPVRTMASLIAEATNLSIDEFRSALHSLGGKYAKIADPGYARPSLPNDKVHTRILDRLIEAGVVAHYKEDGQALRVFMRRSANI